MVTHLMEALSKPLQELHLDLHRAIEGYMDEQFGVIIVGIQSGL